MTLEKTPPVSEGWPTPDTLTDVEEMVRSGHVQLGGKYALGLLAIVRWAVETRPKLEALVADWESLQVGRMDTREIHTVGGFKLAAEELRAILKGAGDTGPVADEP